MYSICIADDEVYVLKSIEQRVRDSGTELWIAGTASNGLEALSLYERERPDIFLVDINMPIVNGLDFIEKIRRQDYETDTRFVIVSGYDDFAFMKRAIRLGVSNYLKKPILQAEFDETMRELCAQLDQNRKKSGSGNPVPVCHWSDFTEEKRDGWLTGTLLLLKQPGIAGGMERICAGLAGQTGPVWRQIVSGAGNPDIALLYSETEHLDAKTLGAMKCFEGAAQIVCYSGRDRRLEEVIFLLEDTLNLRFYRKCDRIMMVQARTAEKPELSFEAYGAALENTWENKYSECIRAILQPLFAEEKYAYSLRQAYQSFILTIVNLYMKYDLPLPNRIRRELFPFSMAAFENARMMTAALEEYSYELNQKIILAVSGCGTVDRVVRYLEHNYSSEISLKSLSEMFFVAPTYLSKKFKEKKGYTVMQYLENVRLRRAREMLETSDLAIGEISEAVGYNDQNYFARSFRKIYGVSPSEYRGACR